MWNPNISEEESRKDVSISEGSRNPIDLCRGKSEDLLKDKEDCMLDSESGGIDSGFLSGPQLSGFHSEEDFIDSGEIKKETVAKQSQQQQQQMQQNPLPPKPLTKTNIDSTFTDSGCIEDSGYSIQDEPKKDTAEQMILDSGVDSGLSEWFCNLSIKNSDQPLNNLGSAATVAQTKQKKSSAPGAKRAPVIAENPSSQQQLQQEHNNRQPWEIYYQQNSDGDTQLHIAVIIGYTEVVCALIRLAIHPCLLDIQNDNCQSALHLAVLTKQTDIVRRLLVAGAKATIRDSNGNTPLHLACISGHLPSVKALTIPITATEIQEVLVSKKSSASGTHEKSSSYPPMVHRCTQLPQDLELRNYDGKQCIHLAAEGTHLEVLRHLVWFGADINAREGKSGQTPLHMAIETCNDVLTNFLLQECQKLNLETTTYGGLTAYQIAAINRSQQLITDLKNHGAEPLTPPESEDDSDFETDFDDAQIYNRFGDPGFFVSFNGGKAINVA